MELNQEQQKAANILTGNLLIIASAGTGKTTTIVERYLRLLDSGVRPDEIIMTTFTNKAAKDMINKISKRTNKISPFVGTMHSIFLRILRDNKKLVFGEIEATLMTDRKETNQILKGIIKNIGINPNANAVRYFSGWISKFKSRCIFADSLSWEGGIDELKSSGQISELMDDELVVIDASWRSKVNHVYKMYQKYLEEKNLMDFDEVLMLTYKLFNDNDEIRNEYKNNFKSIMVDEAQDLNVVQMKILELLENNNLCLIGDDCQNIYEWRGSSNDLVFKFRENENEITLKENYRSTSHIIKSVNNIIDSMKNKIDKELVLTRAEGNRVTIDICGGQFDEIERIADKIESRVEYGEKFEDMAVLFRTNFVGKMIQRELLKRQIPCHLSRSVDFFDREEIKDMISFLKLKVNAFSAIDFERIVGLIEGIGKIKIEKFIYLANKNDMSLVECLDFATELKVRPESLERIQILKECLMDDNSNAVDLFINKFGYLDILANKYAKQESKLSDKFENLRVFQKLFQDMNGNEDIIGFLDSIMETDKREVTSGKVVLTTIHGAKGLEWKHVFIASVNERTLPFYKMELSDAKRDSELRLFYVAVSRAKDNLHITCSKSFRMEQPSHFLELIETGKSKMNEGFMSADELEGC
ncbi:ATP-dependent helicase [Candidatus Pacearchaeota archaeon]|nr:ATP-dependent helicase [Candidatus Pacearchaeota archaeon]